MGARSAAEVQAPSAATEAATTSAIEEASLRGALPFDRFDTTPEPVTPAYVWVRFAAENAPPDGLDYRSDDGGIAAPAPPRPVADAPRPGHGPQRPKALSINVVRIELSPDEAYVDQKSGLVDRKLFISLARKNAFPASRVGNRYLAKLADVQRYIEGHRLHPRAATPPDGGGPAVDELDEIRRNVGLRPKGTR
jgi:hypothetical protein